MKLPELARFAASLCAIAFIAVSAAEEGHHHHHWDYSADYGPSHWSELEPDFEACGTGHLQSPIDIRNATTAMLAPIQFDYHPSPLHIIDNGHTVQVNYAPGSSISVGGQRYELAQFHFHKPSEEMINGKASPMEVHLVHKGSDGTLAVVGVLLQKGSANSVIKTLWANLPTEKEKEKSVDSVKVDAAGFIPASHTYYTYTGSLTTPPCSEGVKWFVMAHPTNLSKNQIARFGAIYQNNARPVQALNGRQVQVSQ